MRSDLTEVIERGAARLNTVAPDRIYTVDTTRLDVRSTAERILGQTFGDYATGKEKLGIKDASPYGFIYPRRHVLRDHDDALVLAELDRRWIEYIETRRAARRLVAEAEEPLAGMAPRS